MVNYALDIRDLRVRRGGTEVLHGLTVTVPTGAMVGLLGPSGCGKTTLMRAIVGVQRIESGSISVLARQAGDPDLRRQVAYVTQSASVYDDLTVAQNVDYFRRILGAPRGDIARVLAAVDLQAQAAVVVGSLSGGERSRVSLAAALVGEPELLVLDEPTVGLDPVLRRDLWNLFSRLAATGVTLLVSSHVMDEATRCDRLLLMRDGNILADDTPSGLLERTGASDTEHAFLSLIDTAALHAKESS